MAIDEFEKVNEAEARENAREQRGARVRAMWRAHPVWFTVGALVVLYAAALGNLMLKPGHHGGSSLFLGAGIVTLAAFAFLLLRPWRKRRAGDTRSDWP